MRQLKPLVLAALAAALLALPATAAAGVKLQGVDASAYPTMRATVVSSAGAGVKPAVQENGRPVVGRPSTSIRWGQLRAVAALAGPSSGSSPYGAGKTVSISSVQVSPDAEKPATSLSSMSRLTESISAAKRARSWGSNDCLNCSSFSASERAS